MELKRAFHRGRDCIDCGGEGAYPRLFPQQAAEMARAFWERDAAEGLLTFSRLEEAADGIEAINTDYARHARAAREIAVEYFDSDKVLTRLLARLGVG